MSQANTTKSTIFYADDDTDDLELLSEAFGCYSKDIELITARNGLEALSYFTNLSPFEPEPCLVILDINMPFMSGKEVLKTIRKMDRFKDNPVVLFTTSSAESDKAYAIEHNAGFITKPIDVKQMEKIADAFMEFCTDETKKSLRKEIH